MGNSLSAILQLPKRIWYDALRLETVIEGATTAVHLPEIAGLKTPLHAPLSLRCAPAVHNTLLDVRQRPASERPVTGQ